MAKPSRNSYQPRKPVSQHGNAQPQQNIQMTWTGPLPPPGALQQFNEIIPDGANRIMTMIEEEQRHRISHDDVLLKVMSRDTRRGHLLGGAISICSICGAVGSVYLHAPAAVSVALVGIPVLGMIKAIVGNKTK